MGHHQLTGLIPEHPGLPEDTQKYLIAFGRGVFMARRYAHQRNAGSENGDVLYNCSDI